MVNWKAASGSSLLWSYFCGWMLCLTPTTLQSIEDVFNIPPNMSTFYMSLAQVSLHVISNGCLLRVTSTSAFYGIPVLARTTISLSLTCLSKHSNLPGSLGHLSSTPWDSTTEDHISTPRLTFSWLCLFHRFSPQLAVYVAVLHPYTLHDHASAVFSLAQIMMVIYTNTPTPK